ncbi:unnamed protein product [Mucor hiemalis]
MFGNLGCLLTTSTRKLSCQHVMQATKRFASTSTIAQNNQQVVLDRALFQYTPLKETASTASVSEYISRLRPFNAPAVPQPTMSTPKVVEELELTSVLRKRRLKMNKHKHKKLRKRTRALRKKLGK